MDEGEDYRQAGYSAYTGRHVAEQRGVREHTVELYRLIGNQLQQYTFV